MKTLRIKCQELHTYPDNSLGVYDGIDNIGLSIPATNLVSAKPYMRLNIIQADINVPDDYEPPDILDRRDWEIF